MIRHLPVHAAPDADDLRARERGHDINGASHATKRFLYLRPREAEFGIAPSVSAPEDDVAAPDLPDIDVATAYADRARHDVWQRLGHQHIGHQRGNRGTFTEPGCDNARSDPCRVD